MIAKFAAIRGLKPVCLNQIAKLTVFSLWLLELNFDLRKLIKPLFIPKSSFVVSIGKRWVNQLVVIKYAKVYFQYLVFQTPPETVEIVVKI